MEWDSVQLLAISWVLCTSECHPGKKHQHPRTHPFIVGMAKMGSQLMTYSVSSHQMHHLPGVWDDVFDVMHQAMPVCSAQLAEPSP